MNYDTTFAMQFDVLPMSLNKALRAHRFKFARQNKLWVILVQRELHRQRSRDELQTSVSRPPLKPIQNARIRIVRHAWRTLDYDGLVGSMKSVVDALVSCGVLADDTWKVTGAWEVTQQFRPKKDGVRLEVRVSYNAAQTEGLA